MYFVNLFLNFKLKLKIYVKLEFLRDGNVEGEAISLPRVYLNIYV